MKSLDDIRVVDVPCFPDRQGLLVAYNGIGDFGVPIRRVFVVTAHAKSLRGKHAHKVLTQILVCLQGACRVACDDGIERQEYLLDQPNCALVIPCGIWAEQFFPLEDSILMVLCDQPFDESDYLRDYADFLRFRGLKD